MKNVRRGMGKGMGCGYKNIAPMDAHIHSLSAKGVKTNHQFVPNVVKTRQKNKGVWTCIDCGEDRDVTSVAMLEKKKPYLQLVTQDTEVEGIKDILGSKANGYDAFFVKVGDGDYDEVWGIEGNVPYLNKTAYRLKAEGIIKAKGKKLNALSDFFKPIIHYKKDNVYITKDKLSGNITVANKRGDYGKYVGFEDHPDDAIEDFISKYPEDIFYNINAKGKKQKSLDARFEIVTRKGKDWKEVSIINARDRKGALKKVKKQNAYRKKLKKEGKTRCFFCNRPKKIIDAGYMEIMDMPDSKIKGKLRYLPMDKRETGDNDFGDTPACFKCIPKKYGRL